MGRSLPAPQVPDENNSLLGFSDIKFSNNGNMILAAVEGRLYLLDAYKGSVIKRFNTVMTEGGAAGEAAISADNKYLIAGTTTHACVRGTEGAGMLGPMPGRTWAWHTPRVCHAVGGREGKGRPAGGASAVLQSCAFCHGMPRIRIAVPSSIGTHCARALPAGCDDSNIRVWHIESGVTVATWTGHAGVPGCLKTAPRRLMVASACNALCMWVPNLHVLDRLGAAPH